MGQEGSELLKGYGEQTHSLNPPVSFIPTIALDKNQDDQKDILKNLLKVVCSRYKVSSTLHMHLLNLIFTHFYPLLERKTY